MIPIKTVAAIFHKENKFFTLFYRYFYLLRTPFASDYWTYIICIVEIYILSLALRIKKSHILVFTIRDIGCPHNQILFARHLTVI
ncbi:hypothetical protein D3C85_1410680 [compost metagenome]